MSTRALRKQEQAKAKNTKLPAVPAEAQSSENEEDEDDESTRLSRQKARNFFALLDDGGDEEENEAANEVVEESEANSAVGDNQKCETKKKKKAKQKKAKAKRQQEQPAIETDESILAEALLQAAQVTKVDSELIRKRAALMRIEAKYLLSDFEIRKRFGSSVSDQLQQDRVPRHVLKINTKLTRPKMNWPDFRKLGMDMVIKETKKVNGRDVTVFEYRHSKEYEVVQQEFWNAVHSHDPNMLTNLHHAAPYHIDTLLQLSEMLRMHDNHPEAADVIERALFALEASAHPQFTLTNVASVKLDYAKRENRALFVALFLHGVSLARRSCYRTALEITKVLLQLDSATVASETDAAASAGDPDPLGASLAVDFYALKANEADWLIDWYNAEDESRCLHLLPNFAYSYAFALRTKALRVAKQRSAASATSSSVESASQLQADADRALRYALLQFPGVLNSLLERLSVQPDPYVERHPHFSALHDRYRDPRELKQLEALYASRCAPLWKGELSWLEESVRSLCTELDAVKATSGKTSVSTSDPSASSLQIDCQITPTNLQRFERVRQTSFQRTPRNVLRHLILSECKPALEHAASYLTGLTITSYDPLPPSNSYEAYSYHAPDHVAQQRNLLQLFFESLMPGYNPEADAENRQASDAIERVARNTANALRDALRAVMDNLHRPAPENAPDAAASASAEQNHDSENQEDDDDDAEWTI